MTRDSNFGLKFDLDETAEMIRDTVSSFAQAEIAPRAAEIDKSDPSFKLDIDKKRVPAESLEFPLVLQFKPPVEEAAKGKPKAKK